MNVEQAQTILHALYWCEAALEYGEDHDGMHSDFSALAALFASARQAVMDACPCVPKVQHASDCALHNAPAFLPGPCDCGAVAKAQRKYDARLSLSGCSRLARLKTRFRIWSRRVFG